MHVLIQLGIGGHRHAVGRRSQIISRIVVEGGAGPDNNRLALHSRDGRKDISREGQVRRPFLQAHLTEALANRDLCHLVRIDTEAPVARYSRAV